MTYQIVFKMSHEYSIISVLFFKMFMLDIMYKILFKKTIFLTIQEFFK